MKKYWIFQWETIPGKGEQQEKFTSFEKAKAAFRRKICECVNLDEFIGDLEPHVAKFMKNFLADPEFPRTDEDIPEEYEEPERGELYLSPHRITWKYPYDAFPEIDTDLVLTSDPDDSYSFDFCYHFPEEADGKGVLELSMRIDMHIDYGNSSHPLMVLNALSSHPKTQDQIISSVFDLWETALDRKTVGRNLKTLKELGLPIHHCAEGYYLEGEFSPPDADVKFGSGAYPVMILLVTDGTYKTQAETARLVYERFGIKIERKAIGRHLKLLREMEMIKD